MSAKLIGGFPDNFVIEGTVTAGVAIAEGDFLAINGVVLQRATSSSTIHTIMGVAAETITITATKIKFVPFVQGQLWEVTGNADVVVATMIYDSYALTNHAVIANDGTDVGGATGVFTVLGYAGALTDKRLIGEFTRLQSTSN